ncbi:tetratricopeptide repeat protein [Helicobacter sp. T3_23-1056]
MKKAIFVCGILAGLVSVGYSAMSDDERTRAKHNCFDNDDKSACQALIDNDLYSVEQCDEYTCGFAGMVYMQAGLHKGSIPYFEKLIALGDNDAYHLLGFAYDRLNDYFNAKKYYEISCNTGNATLGQKDSCFGLGYMYHTGKGVRQDYHKARELWKKACDMKNAMACNNLGALYGEGLGVKQNLTIAKQYYGKACDLGDQTGCDNYKNYNEAGVQ